MDGLSSPGTGGISIVLSNESHTIPCNGEKVPTSYANSGTSIYVYEGPSLLTYDGTGTVSGRWKISSNLSGINRGTLVNNGTYVTVGDSYGMTSDTAYIAYTISGMTNNGIHFSVEKK